MNIQTEIKNTFAAVLALTLIIVVVLTLINGPTNYKQAQPFLMPLKEAIATTANYFGGITALAAAYIATRMYSHWSDEKAADIASNFSMRLIEQCREIDDILTRFGFFKTLYLIRDGNYIDTKFEENNKNLEKIRKSMHNEFSVFLHFLDENEREIYKKYHGYLITYNQLLSIIETYYKHQQNTLDDDIKQLEAYNKLYDEYYIKMKNILLKYYSYKKIKM